MSKGKTSVDNFTFRAEHEDAGERLDLFLTGELEEKSRSFITSSIKKGLVSVNSTVIEKAGYALKEGDTVSITVEDAVPLSTAAENIPLDVVYEDGELAVINKAQGMVTHPAAGSPAGTLVNALLYRIKDLSSINGVIRPGIVHRLDKDTSGLLVVAKTDFAHISLSSQIAQKSAKRYYLALVDGNIKEDIGEIDKPIDRSRADRKKMAVSAEGRRALTRYKVLERFGNYTFVEFELFTGRTHQIRVHANYIRHPVVGDRLYGGSDRFGLAGQLLHAYKLEFSHPVSGERLSFSAPLPPYFQKVLETLRKSAEGRFDGI